MEVSKDIKVCEFARVSDLIVWFSYVCELQFSLVTCLSLLVCDVPYIPTTPTHPHTHAPTHPNIHTHKPNTAGKRGAAQAPPRECRQKQKSAEEVAYCARLYAPPDASTSVSGLRLLVLSGDLSLDLSLALGLVCKA